MSIEEYYLPKSIEETIGILDDPGQDLLVLAGGTLAMPLINEGISTPQKVVGLKNAGLNYIDQVDGELIIGATTTLTQMESQEDLPILKDAAQAVGGWAIRNMATVGGNLFAPPPGGDFAVALLALDAKVVIASNGEERTIPINEFFTGFMTNVLDPGEIVKELRIPLPAGQTSYQKFGRRGANTPSIVTIAVNLRISEETVEDAKIALGAVGPHPFRAIKAEDSLVGKSLTEKNIQVAGALAVSESEPFTDPIASTWYREKMIPIILSRCLESIQR
ncbi:MAG: xanthine dehydrogenase family protein subunit M [Chloroflexota bacterium]|nr:MAG: xanthine dehydrogenase family protein subunit M [Chloroflexota bacterium]